MRSILKRIINSRLPIAAAVCLFVTANAGSAATARAELISHGPVIAFAYSEVKDFQYYIPSLGWRARFAPPQRLGNWMNGLGTDLSLVLEGLGGIVTGDDDTFEVQLLPLARFEPSGTPDRSWLPFLELGIGILYTGLEDIGLGDNFLFSSNAGAGVSLRIPQPFPFTRIGVGYRFRHASHAGLFGEKNVGSNSHYLTFTFD